MSRGPAGPAPATWDPASAPWVMGVVNVTPDSFSDGGRYLAAEAAIAHGVALWRAGADVLDVGGEATGPRATPVAAAEETDRVVAVIAGLRAATPLPLSIDTTKASVAAAALAAGATIVNDVAGGRFDPGIWEVAAAAGAVYVCGHLRGGSLAEVYAAEGDVSVAEVTAELGATLDAMPPALRARVVVDPGLGFGKGSAPANWALLDGAGAMARALAAPVLVGASRKRFLRRAIEEAGQVATEAALDLATAAASVRAVRAGAAGVRVHDVAGTCAALGRRR
ncbi:MAG: dihydropteroate synthase [Kofleriaceae bacterium]